MKYVIVLPDGAADYPLPELGGQTPLQAANLPHTDAVARRGVIGRVRTVPAGYTPGTDVATLTLMGYEPARYFSGRAPIEAAARGLSASEDELIFRCNFVTITDGRMRDFTADHIDQAEAQRLSDELNDLARAGDPALAGCRFFAGVSYRNLLILAGAGHYDLECAPPHDIPDQPVDQHQPRGSGAGRVCAIMRRAAALLRDHEINRRRAADGRPPVTDIWLWGQGRPVALPTLQQRFGLRGAAITGVDIIRGLAVLMGMELIEVPGATGYLDTDYRGKGAAALAALDDHDLVAVHVEAPDEAGHLGDARAKVAALEQIDELIVGPLLQKLEQHGRWRLLVAPDHPTPCGTTAHDAAPPPFCYAGTGVPASEAAGFHEQAAEQSGLLIDPGHTLIERFFTQGL